MTENFVTVSFEIEEELYNEISRICTKFGTTAERVCSDFLKFCANPENISKVKEILGIEE